MAIWFSFFRKKKKKMEKQIFLKVHLPPPYLTCLLHTRPTHSLILRLSLSLRNPLKVGTLWPSHLQCVFF